MRLLLILTSMVFLSSNVLAETPNINPGFWEHNTRISLQGPFNLPAQVNSDQECITQADIDKGIDVIDLPSGCSLTEYDIQSDKADYTMVCDIEGMRAEFKGRMQFQGDRMSGNMTSEVESPLGVMTMQMETEAQRVRDC